jgi:hypothetical protein
MIFSSGAVDPIHKASAPRMAVSYPTLPFRWTIGGEFELFSACLLHQPNISVFHYGNEHSIL